MGTGDVAGKAYVCGSVGGFATCATLVCAFLVPYSTRAGEETTSEPELLIAVDRAGDAVERRTDPTLQLLFEPEAHRLVDLLQVTVGSWQPDDARKDLFSGAYAEKAAFLRLDLIVSGLMNPPGTLGPSAFNPFRYGPHPIFGFIEIDMDDDASTGGELNAPQFRYLGNVARFGGLMLDDDLHDRVALDETAFDDNFSSPPYVERSGEEFHLALFGEQFSRSDIDRSVGDQDDLFEQDEIWTLRGRFFHRAHGYEPFSFAKGGNLPGEYAPICDVRFAHESDAEATTISLVFPMTNVGAALVRNEAVEPNDQDPTNHASVDEALADLVFSADYAAMFPSGLPEEELVDGWAGMDPDDYLEPADWRLTAIFGTSYSKPSGSGVFLVWSDIYPDVVCGDVDGSGEVSLDDHVLIEDFMDEDDSIDGVIVGFAQNFNLYDTNYDGIVNLSDLKTIVMPGDSDEDGDVDLRDFAQLQLCFGPDRPAEPHCEAMDFNDDDQIDLDDVSDLGKKLTGPQNE